MRRLKFVLRCTISVALVVLVFRKVDWHALSDLLSRVDWRWAALASGLTFVLIAGLAFRWRIFLRQQAIDLPFGRVLSLTWAGQFFNSLLPGSTGGDVFKMYEVCRLAPDRKAAAAAAVLLDRLSALVALVALASLAFILEPGPLLAVLTGWKIDTRGAAWLIVALLAGVASLYVILRRVVSGTLWARLRRVFAAVRLGLSPDPKLAFGLASAVSIHLLNFLSVFLFARSLGLQITFAQVTAMMPVVLLLTMLPVTINGHGLRELLLIGYITYMGVRVHGRTDIQFRDVAVAWSLLLVSNDLLWSFPGGIRYLARRRVAGFGESSPLPGSGAASARHVG